MLRQNYVDLPCPLRCVYAIPLKYSQAHWFVLHFGVYPYLLGKQTLREMSLLLTSPSLPHSQIIIVSGLSFPCLFLKNEADACIFYFGLPER